MFSQKSMLCIVLLIGCILIANNAEAGANDTTLETSPLLTANNAIEKALQYTGFDKSKGFSKSDNVQAKLKKIANISIPFANDKFIKDNVWHVYFEQIEVGQQTTKLTLRDFLVLLERKTGKLLMIYSISEIEGSSDTLPQPLKVAAEKYFRDRKYQIYNIPEKVSDLTFWEALQKVRMASPSSSKIIKAYYWDFSTGKNHYPYSWLIIHRGMEQQIPTSHGNEHNPIGNNLMSCIDAKNGKVHFETTGPFDRDDIKNQQGEKK